MFRRDPERLVKDAESRLIRAIEKAETSRDRERAISELHSGVEREAKILVDAAKPDAVIQAYRTMVNLSQHGNQYAQAVKYLGELRSYEFGTPHVLEMSLPLANVPNLGETEWLVLLDWFDQANRLGEIIPSLRKVVDERFRRNTRVKERLGDALVTVGEYQDAAEHYHDVIDMFPAEGAKFIPKLEKILEADPNNPLAQETLGRLYFEQRDYEQAVTHLRLALDWDAFSVESLFALADAHRELRPFDQAVEILERLLAKPGNEVELIHRCEILTDLDEEKGTAYWRIQRLWGDALRHQDRFDEALGRYRQALDNLPKGQAGEFAKSLASRLEETTLQISPANLAEAQLELGRAQTLAGDAQRAYEAFVTAVKTERGIAPSTISGLRALISSAKKFLPARLYLAELQMEQGDLRGAFDTLESIRKELPSAQKEVIDSYRYLLKTLEKSASDKELVRGSNASTLSGTLYALAEALAVSDPAEAILHLSRALEAFGAEQAAAVREHLKDLKLFETQSLKACLLEGDAYLAQKVFDKAIDAYRRAPLNAQTVDEVCQRLEALAKADAVHPDGLVTSAEIRLQHERPDLAISLLSQAFERDQGKMAPVCIAKLETLHQSGKCSTDGLSLLVEAYNQKGDAHSLLQAHDVLRELFTNEPQRAGQIAAQCQRVHQKVRKETKTYTQVALLLGEAYIADGNHAGAVPVFADIVGHTQVDEAALLAQIKAITQQKPELFAAWLAFGDALCKQKKPDISAGMDAYSQALKRNPDKCADDVIQRLAVFKLKGKTDPLKQSRLLKAEALARTGRAAAAISELRGILIDHGQSAFEGVGQLCELLPDETETWFLRSEYEADRGKVEESTTWLAQIITKGTESEINRTEAALRKLSDRFPKAPEPRLVHAKSLIRLGRNNEAADELGDIGARFPSARADALLMSEGMIGEAPKPEVWLARARIFIENDNVPSALASLRNILPDDAHRSEAYALLQTVFKKHASDADVLQTLVTFELKQDTLESLEHAITHTERWLDQAEDQADAVVEKASQVINALDDHGEGKSPSALQARLIFADALLGAGQPERAAQQLNIVLATWPAETAAVLSRCQQSLERGETLDIRLAYVDAFMAQGSFDHALEACQGLAYTEPAACRELAQRCDAIWQAAQSDDPTLAAQASAVLAEWDARLENAPIVIEACREAVRLDASQLKPITSWMQARGWDVESRRTLTYATAAFLRDAGDPTLEEALQVYRVILEANFQAESQDVLDALDQFPIEYIPAWNEKLEISIRGGKPFYERAFGDMEKMLTISQAQLADEMLLACGRMDAQEPGVYFVRSKIYETAGQLKLAASTLLELQKILPDEFPKIESHLLGLIQRHPEAYFLPILLGDAYQKIENWDAALEAYQAVQQATDDLLLDLIQRYETLLSHVPENIIARWGLAQAHRTLAQPQVAARYVDEMTDLDPGTSEQAGEFIHALVDDHPGCGQAWYVHGKLAFRDEDYPHAIEYLERAGKEGELTPNLVLLSLQMLGKAYSIQGLLDPALENTRKAIELAPEDVGLRQLLLSIRVAMLDRQVAEEEKKLKAAKDPVVVALKLAELLQQRGDYPRAVKLLQSMLFKADKLSEIHRALARCFAAQEMYHLSAASLEAAIATGELDLEGRKETYYRLAQAYRSQLCFDEALEALEQVCALDVTYQNVLGFMDTIQREKVIAAHQAVPLRLVSKISLITEGR